MKGNETSERLYEAGDELTTSKMMVPKGEAVPLWMAKAVVNGLVNRLYEKNIPMSNCSFHFAHFAEEGTKKTFAVGAAMATVNFTVVK